MFPYLGIGVYCYADYDSCGMWNNNLSHRIPEVLLPYAIVDSEIKTSRYNLTDLDCKNLSINKALYNKNRSSDFVNLGNLISKLCFAKKTIEDTSPENKGSWYGEYEIKQHKEKQDEVNQLLLLLPNVYQKFVDSHKNYNAQLSNYIEPNEPSTENFSK